MRVGRDANIDALRGIAALLVIWLHSAEVFITLPQVSSQSTFLYDLANLLGLGRTGVIAFFAISGYVIVPTLRSGSHAISGFLIKRFFRLYPLFWAAVAAASLSAYSEFGAWPSIVTISANLTMVPLEFQQRQIFGHFWTLEVELIFYALIIAFFHFNVLAKERVIAIFLICTAVLWNVLYRTPIGASTVAHNMVWTFLPYFLSVMFWGSMIRERLGNARPGAGAKAKSVWPFVVVTLLVFGRPLLALAFGSSTVNQEDWRGTLLGLSLFLLVILIPRASLRLLAPIGTISYSLYLFHQIFLHPIFSYIQKNAITQKWLLAYLIAACALLTILLSIITYRFIELPSNRWAHKFVKSRLDAPGASRLDL